jgi:hypothetical protein
MVRNMGAGQIQYLTDSLAYLVCSRKSIPLVTLDS